MKFTCDKKLLWEAVAGVSKAVTTSSSVPVLQGILLHGEAGQLTLTGYDLEIAITTSIEANIIQPGRVVINAKFFGEILRSLASDEVSMEVDKDVFIHLQGGITEYDFVGLAASDYPELPSPGADHAFDIDAAELALMINTTLYAVSTDDKKPIHTGELFSIDKNELTIVALDGFRLAITKHPIMSDQTIDIVVPAKTASEVARLMGDAGENIQVDANNRYVVFSNGKYTVMSRLIEGDFLNYKSVVPDGPSTRVVVDVAAFEKSIERCSVIITERLKNPLQICFDEDIQIRCQTPMGKVSDKLQAQVDGDRVEIGFNYRYLLDALKNSGCDQIVMEIVSNLKPVKIMPVEGEEFLFLVLPVRFKND